MKYPQYLMLGCLIVLGLIVIGTALMDNPLGDNQSSGFNDTNDSNGNNTICINQTFFHQCEETPELVFNQMACENHEGCSWDSEGQFCLGYYNDTWLNCTVIEVPDNKTIINNTNSTPPVVADIPHVGGGSSYCYTNWTCVNGTAKKNNPRCFANETDKPSCNNSIPNPIRKDNQSEDSRFKLLNNSDSQTGLNNGQTQQVSAFTQEILDHKTAYIIGAILVLGILAIWIFNPKKPNSNTTEVKAE